MNVKKMEYVRKDMHHNLVTILDPLLPLLPQKLQRSEFLRGIGFDHYVLGDRTCINWTNILTIDDVGFQARNCSWSPTSPPLRMEHYSVEQNEFLFCSRIARRPSDPTGVVKPWRPRLFQCVWAFIDDQEMSYGDFCSEGSSTLTKKQASTASSSSSSSSVRGNVGNTRSTKRPHFKEEEMDIEAIPPTNPFRAVTESASCSILKLLCCPLCDHPFTPFMNAHWRHSHLAECKIASPPSSSSSSIGRLIKLLTTSETITLASVAKISQLPISAFNAFIMVAFLI